jgi:hypothetical protein
MAEDTAREDFDWVSAQAACTAEAMFERLMAGVRRDVERRNALPDRADHFHFEVLEEDGRVEVTREIGAGQDPPRVHAAVAFERAGPRINVQGDGVDIDFTAVVGINPAGACRYFVAEAEYTEWEVRKLALDVLFFEDVEE